MTHSTVRPQLHPALPDKSGQVPRGNGASLNNVDRFWPTKNHHGKTITVHRTDKGRTHESLF